jgi:hypothetical protein
VKWRTGTTAAGPLEVPHVALRIRLPNQNGEYLAPLEFQWDSGAELSMMSERVAREHGIDLTTAEETTFVGTSGGGNGWLVHIWVRFPSLADLQFKLLFLVHKGSDDPLPLLGMLDTFQNFNVISRDDEYFFYLKPAHCGSPLPPS